MPADEEELLFGGVSMPRTDMAAGSWGRGGAARGPLGGGRILPGSRGAEIFFGGGFPAPSPPPPPSSLGRFWPDGWMTGFWSEAGWMTVSPRSLSVL